MSDRGLFVDIALARGAFNLRVKTAAPPQGITAIFGPSGSGKSSLLRAIAGFETPQSGRIAMGDFVLFDSAKKINAAPHKRGVGYMFQDARLFAHLDVRGNLEFAHSRAPDNGASFDHIVSAFDISALLRQPVQTLSGGERQRVAMARTVLTRPSILLLDEPLAALDTARKAELMPFIHRLAGEFGMSVLYVSHDLKEVGTLADTIVCLKEGQLTASGPAIDILPTLQIGDTAQGDFSTWFDAKITRCDAALMAATLTLSANHELIVPLTRAMPLGGQCRVAICADDVSIALSPPQGVSIQNILDVRVKSVTQRGARVHVTLDWPDAETTLPDLSAFITPLAQSKLRLTSGQNVSALVKSVSLSS